MNYYLLFFLIILVFEIGLCSALFYWFQPKLGTCVALPID